MTAKVSTADVESAEAEVKAEEGLILGKFKTQEDLAAAYAELEKKMSDSAEKPDEGGDNGGEGAGDSDEEAEADRYGTVVTAALEAAGISVDEVDAELEADGRFSDKTRQAFVDAGFPLVLVEAAERGMTQGAAETTAIGEEQIASLKNIAGGEAGYDKLRAWVASSYTSEQIAAYDEAVSSGDFAKAQVAVQEAQAAYTKEFGTEGVRQVSRPSDQTPKGFTSDAAFLEAMADPRYKTSAAFRAEVAEKLNSSPNVFLTR